MYRPCLFALAILIPALVAFATPPAEGGKMGQAQLKIAPDIDARLHQFVKKTLTADLSSLAENDRKALDHLVEAAKKIHQVFMRQAWRENPAFAAKVAALRGRGADAAREYFRIMAKPWDGLRDHEPFVGETVRPRGAGFYPEDLTKAEFERFVAAHPGEKERLASPTTVIHRGVGGALVAVGYGKEYGDLLGPAAAELRKAADLSTNASLAKFLRLRADALLSDDYYASDLAWMDLDGAIEVVIGPYETYEDSLLGYKAAFESFVCVSQPRDSERLAHYKKELPYLEKNLPIPDEHKNLKRGSASPIRVADVVYGAGDARSGVQTVAFNLPNDERAREAKGSKNVLLKNMMQAKYEAILVPIAARVLPEADRGRLDPDTYFHLILFHELSHGLGPGRIVVGGKPTEVRLEMKELYPAIEEAKADVLGVYNLYALADKGIVPAKVVEPLPWTYTAGLFRSARFGVSDAHGRGVVLQADYLISRGAIEVTPDGMFRPVTEKFRPAIRDLAHELLMVEALGDYAGAQRLLETYGTPPPAMMRRLETLKDIPVDVDPFYALYERN